MAASSGCGSDSPAWDFEADLPKRDSLLHPPSLRVLLHLLWAHDALRGGRISPRLESTYLLGLPGWEIASKLLPGLHVLLQCEPG